MKARKLIRTSQLANQAAAMSDRELGRLLRRSHLFRKPKRARRGSTVPRWTPAEDRLLGKWPDAKVAKHLRRSYRQVQWRRRKLGILVRPRPRKWTPAEDQVLAQARSPLKLDRHARELARRLGRSFVAVQMRRRQLFGRRMPAFRRWTRREIGLLGSRQDQEVGALIGRTRGAVMAQRRALGISAFIPRRKWPAAEDRSLRGSEPDRVLSARLGRTPAAIYWRRRKLGLATPDARFWTKNQERLLGTKPDEEIARKLRRSVNSVAQRRRQRGLAPAILKYRPWTKSEDKLLGTDADPKIARRLGRTRAAVTVRRQKLGIASGTLHRWTASQDALLGTAPDKQIALRLGRTPAAVQLRRLKLGIGCVPANGVRPWAPAEIRLLGSYADRAVAHQIGRGVKSVAHKRRTLGIRPAKPTLVK